MSSKKKRIRAGRSGTPEQNYLHHIVPNATRIHGKTYGEIAGITGLNRTQVKRALQWGIDNDHTRTIEGPTSRPADNVVEINQTPTVRGTRTDKWNRGYIETRTTNKLLNTAKQKAATETDPLLRPLHQASVAQAEASLAALKSQAAIQDAIEAIQGSNSNGESGSAAV